MGEIVRTGAGALTAWEQAAAENAGNYIQGDSIRFRDGRYFIGKEGRAAPEAMRLVVADLRSVWVRWENGRPAEQVEQRPGERLITLKELGFLHENEWEEGLDGSPQDPWQDSRYLGLVDPKTAASYTFITATRGGRSAIAALSDQIARAQRAHLGALPIIELRWVEMPTQYGRKTKPLFEVVDWRRGEGAEPPPPSAPERARGQMTIESGRRAMSSNPIDDDIPFAPEWR
jgi:hypothetical protein